MALKTLFLSALLAGLFMAPGLLSAQSPEASLTESGEPVDEGDLPVDGIVEKKLTVEHRVLPYDDIREIDIFWEKRIWRVIDVREKMNKHFIYPDRPFFKILLDAAINEDITVYSPEDDKFLHPLTADEVAAQVSFLDTTIVFDPETYEEIIQVVRNEINPEDIKRFRLKEDWFFDRETSTLQVRILGIAPIQDVTDDNGNFLYEKVMFWVYYPDARKVLAREKAYIEGNDASLTSWEDIMEMRYFSSYIYKESNVYDRRLKDYLSGVDLLLESERIKQSIFNFEQDLWSY